MLPPGVESGLLLLAAAIAIIAIAVLLGRALSRQRHTEPDASREHLPRTNAATVPSNAPTPIAAKSATPTPALQKSYAAVAAAQSAFDQTSPRDEAADARTRIYDDNALSGMAPDANYVARALASRGGATRTEPKEQYSSYAAVAAAIAAASPRAIVAAPAPATVIDYSIEPTDFPANASYTAIAVAAAARRQNSGATPA